MAQAILEGRDARCSLERALHGVDVMTSILKSGETGAFVDLQTTCTRPEPLGPDDGAGAAGLRATSAMSYVPAEDRYERHGLPPLRGERADAARDLARALAQLRRGHAARDEARDLPARRSTSASRISTSPTTTGRRRARPRTAFGEILRTDFAGHRDELIVSSKAGYLMWPGPYGEWGSRKYLIASCDASLKRMGLDYVDIFYSHRFDPDTPLEETMGALDAIVRSGKALYVGISSYNSERTRAAAAILKALGTPCVIHQPSYNMINRWVERDGLKETLQRARHRLDRLHAAGAGHADRQVPQGHPRGQPRHPGQVAAARRS